MLFRLRWPGAPTHFFFLEYVNKNEELGPLTIVPGSPQLKGDIKGKVSNAHKGSKKDECFGPFYERNAWQTDLGILLLYDVLLENLKLV